MALSASELHQHLAQYGARAEDIVDLTGGPRPDAIRYLDLIRAPDPHLERPRAIVEVQRRPVLYIAEGRLPAQRLTHLRRVLALRGDAEYVALLEPGRLSIYTAALDDDPAPKPEIVTAGALDAATKIPDLGLAPDRPGTSAGSIHTFLFELLDGVIGDLTRFGVSPNDALSLAGRALFLRFLADRKVIDESDLGQICPDARRIEGCLADPVLAARTSAWLDRTFNGNLLPLSEKGRGTWFGELGGARAANVFGALTNILHHATSAGQLSLKLDWSGIDFAYVPVGLLSQVYEHHSHRYNPAAKKTSIHYTPRHVAEYMVDEAFCGVEQPHRARVLDPAAGAGVFLVAAYRQLVAARWRADSQPPNTATLRAILYEQLTGFDINEPALRLAALSLYLTALELDPDPSPVGKLRFDDLKDRVLFDVRLPGERDLYDVGRAVAGSLGSAVGPEHRARYDLVIGNPPWTAWKKEDTPTGWEPGIKAVVEARLGAERARTFTLPDRVPDLPFFWRAMDWAKPGGRIALAMHGRLLFKQSDVGDQARTDLFEAVRVTGVLNGAAVRLTDYWPKVTAPFCLVFADNEKPPPNSAFYFVSPELEDSLNRRGRLRIDAKAAQPVALSALQERAGLLKTLFRGTSVDALLVERIRSVQTVALAAYWEEKKLAHGLGYQVGDKAGTQQDASGLHGLPDLTEQPERPFHIDPTRPKLPRFERPTLLRPRKRAIYKAPMVLVAQSPSEDRDRGRAWLVERDVAYSRTFFGYSCAGHLEADTLARYLLLLLNSNLVLYYALLVSSQFGVERDTFLKDDIDEFPVRRLETLSAALKNRIKPLSEALIHDAKPPWREIDAWIAKAYGLDRWDQDAIDDTLAVSLPFAAARARAQRRPHRHEVDAYIRRVEDDIRPILAPFGRHATVTIAREEATDPWIFLWVDARGAPASPRQFDVAAFIQHADELGASQIIVEGERPGTLAVGTLAQYRYWTQTRARLLSLLLVQDYADALLAETP